MRELISEGFKQIRLKKNLEKQLLNQFKRDAKLMKLCRLWATETLAFSGLRTLGPFKCGVKSLLPLPYSGLVFSRLKNMV